MIQLKKTGDLPPPGENEEPPVFGSWRTIYLFVLGVHVLIIFLFYLLTHAYA